MRCILSSSTSLQILRELRDPGGNKSGLVSTPIIKLVAQWVRICMEDLTNCPVPFGIGTIISSEADRLHIFVVVCEEVSQVYVAKISLEN